jgi:hypothetical protein
MLLAAGLALASAVSAALTIKPKGRPRRDPLTATALAQPSDPKHDGTVAWPGERA